MSCVGLTKKDKQCRMGGTHRCTKCGALLCGNHVIYKRDIFGQPIGPHCSWCHAPCEFRYASGWGPWGGSRIVAVDRGRYVAPGGAMTAGRHFEATCGRCAQLVTFETTGFPYGPLALPLKHNRIDGQPCVEAPVLIAHEIVELKPMEAPSSLLLSLDYIYNRKKDDE